MNGTLPLSAVVTSEGNADPFPRGDVVSRGLSKGYQFKKAKTLAT
jgi:hypothetical protein